jgi:hypothetical protein
MRVLLVREGFAWLGIDIKDHALGAAAPAALAGDHDHVVSGAQITLLDALLIDEIVVDLELIERVANPTEILRVAPGGKHGEARQVYRVLPDIGRGSERYRLQAEFLHLGLDARTGRHQQGTRGQIGIARLDGLLIIEL